MAKPPRRPVLEQPGEPDQLPDVTPRDLYQTSDIRFVMLEIGKLMSKVDILILDVSKHGDRIDEVRHQVTFVKAVLWVLSGLSGLVILLLGWYFSGKLSVTFA